MYIIGITGGSGSGKTTLVNALKTRFKDTEISILPQDNYYLPIELQQLDNKGIHNFDLPTAIDIDAYLKDIQNLKNGQIVTRQEYVYNNEKAQPKSLNFKPTKILILEGLFIFNHPKLWDLLDLKIYIRTKESLKIIRRIKRDKEERNYPLDDVLYRYEYHVIPALKKYIEPYIDEVDIVINNNHSMEASINVLKGFISYHLNLK